MKKKLQLSRRTVLRGLTRAGVAVGLCPLEAMFDVNGEALAQSGALPKRYVQFYMGNGAPLTGYSKLPGTWNPSKVGAGYALSDALSSLASVKKHVRVVTGLNNPAPGIISGGKTHAGNFSGAMTGLSNNNSASRTGGPTADFVAAKHLGNDTRFRSMQLGVCRAAGAGDIIYNSATFTDAGTGVSYQFSPQAVFNQLFTGFTPSGGGTPAPAGPDPVVERKRSVLDLVLWDANRLKPQLSAQDQLALDAHLTAIREVEKSLQAQPSTPPASSGCVKPNQPASTSDAPTVARQMADLVKIAFACDQTRVIGYMLTKNNSQEVMPWLGFSRTYHDMSHTVGSGNDAGVIANMTKYARWHVEIYAYLVQALASVPEGAGTLLDHTLVVLCSENGNSHYHDDRDMPHLVAGGPSLVTGDFHWRGNGESNSRLWLGLLQALGVPVTKFGQATTALALK